MYRHFRTQVVLRVVLLGATLLGAVGLAVLTTSYVAAGLVGALAVYQIVALIRYVEQTNHDLSRLLQSIQYSDFSQSFTARGRGASFEELAKAFREVMDDFREARAEKEESYRYLETVMQHVGIGLISFRQDGEVELINTAAKRLLRVPRLKQIGDLVPISRELVDTLFRLRSGEKALVKVVDDDELLQLSVYATEFRMRDDLYKLVSIQDIQSELEEAEVEAWQKLTRVLTHEIMNSVAPIASLAATANGLLEETEALPENGAPDAEEEALAADTMEDVRGAVRTIERRSHGLLNFVQAYRRLTRVPTPNFEIIPIPQLFRDVADLMRSDMAERGVRFECTVQPERLDLTADPALIEQVLLNLVKNAMQAAEGTPDAEVRLDAHLGPRGRPVIQVIDNGPGIVEEAMEKIFIPFFTTKKEGSGIGLSLSREIMRQHGGTLTAVSEPGERTVFTLRF
jgi:nitrogen fixation/metabolism regulation signal transduction histidine kinase